MDSLNWIDGWASGAEHQKIVLHEQLHLSLLQQDHVQVDFLLQQLGGAPTMVKNTHLDTMVINNFTPEIANVCLSHGMVFGHKSLWSAFLSNKPSVLKFGWDNSTPQSHQKMMDSLVKHTKSTITHRAVLVCLEELFSYPDAPALLAQSRAALDITADDLRFGLSSGSPKYVTALLASAEASKVPLVLLSWLTQNNPYHDNGITPLHVHCLHQALQSNQTLEEHWNNMQKTMAVQHPKFFEVMDKASASHDEFLALIPYDRRITKEEEIRKISLDHLRDAAYSAPYLSIFSHKERFVPASPEQAMWLSASLAFLEWRKNTPNAPQAITQWLDHPFLRRQFAQSLANTPENMTKILKACPEIVQWRGHDNKNIFHEVLHASSALNWNLPMLLSLAKIDPGAFMDKDDAGNAPYDRACQLANSMRDDDSQEFLDQALLKSSLKQKTRTAKSAPRRKM